MYDEVGYEGNIPYHWGNISAFEKVNRFWKIYCFGGYATHGETFMEKMDDSQVLWWSKGGTLKGESPKRIGFMKDLAYSFPAPMTFYETRQVPETQEELRKLVDSGRPGISDNSLMRCMCRITPEEFRHICEDRRMIREQCTGRSAYYRCRFHAPKGACLIVAIAGVSRHYWRRSGRVPFQNSLASGPGSLSVPGRSR